MRFTLSLMYLCSLILCGYHLCAQQAPLQQQLARLAEPGDKYASAASQQYQKTAAYYQKPELMYPWDALFEVPERQYLAGRYREASARNKLILKNLVNSRDQVQLAWAYLHEAKYMAAEGNFVAFDSLLRKGTALLEKNRSRSLVSYMAGVCKAADAAQEYGRFAYAESYLYKARLIVQNENFSAEETETEQYGFLTAEIDFRLAQVYLNTGNFRQSIDILQQILPFYRERIVKKAKISFNGKTRSLKLSRQEIFKRKYEYVMAMTLLGRAYTGRGEYKRADSVFVYTDRWIHDNASQKSFLGSNILYAFAKNFEEDEKHLDAIQYYMTNLRTAGRRTFAEGSHFYFQLQKGLIYNLMMEGETSHARQQREEALKIAEKYHGSRNLYALDIALMEIRQLLEDGFSREAQEKITVLSNQYQQLLPEDHPRLATLLEMQSAVLLVQGEVENAIEVQKKVVTIRQNAFGIHSLYYHLAEATLASHYIHYTTRFQEAEQLLNHVLPVVHKHLLPYHAAAIRTGGYLADLYVASERYQPALKQLDGLLANVLDHYDDEDLRVAYRYEKLAAVKLKAGDYKGASANLEEAIAVFTQNEMRTTLEYVRSLKTVAYLYASMGLYDYSQETLRRIGQLMNKARKNNADFNINTIDEMAFLYIKTGKYAETEELLQQSVAEKEKRFGTEYRGLVAPLLQLGELYHIQGNYPEAEKYGKRAVSICAGTLGDSSLQYADALSLLGRIYHALGDYEKAEEYTARVIAIRSKKLGSRHIEVANSMTEFVLIKLENKSFDGAEKLLSDARDIVMQVLGENHPQYAEALKNLAMLYIKTGRTEQAFPLLDKADVIWIEKLGKANVHSAGVCMLRGDLYSLKKDFKKAESFYARAKVLYSEIFNQLHPDYVRTVSKLGQMFFIKGDYKNALKNLNESTSIYLTFIKTYFPSLSEREKTKFWNLIKPDFEFYNSLVLQSVDKQPALIGNLYNFALTTKALLLNSSIKVKQRILSSGDPILVAQYRKWIEKKELLATLLSMNNAQLLESGVIPAELEREIEVLEKELSEKSELFARNVDNHPVQWTDVRAQLAPDEAAIEIIRFRHYETGFTDSVMYAALVLSPGTKKYPELVLLNRGKSMENRQLRYYRNCMRLGLPDSLSYSRYWQPIAEKLQGIKRVYLSPDGVYNQINVESLLTPDQEYVIDKINVVMLSNTRDLAQAHTAKKAGTHNEAAYLVGNPKFYSPRPEPAETVAHQLPLRYIEPLPGAEAEVKSLEKLLRLKGWKTAMLIREQASEDSIRRMNSPKVFHIATHGFFLPGRRNDDEPGEGQLQSSPLFRSGLMLKDAGYLLRRGNLNSEDGILTAYEVMNLNFDNTELVVLSACETGLGDVQVGEGVFGLQRAFLVAGADAIIMSLFKVSDQITQKLMVKFYEKWLQTGDRRRAFQEAQREIKAQYPHPMYWGTFNMIGM